MQAARRTVLIHLTRFLGEQRLAELPDADLLERFVAHHDDASFAVLVRRHGPRVLGLCRSLLGQEQDADDAFQAAFLVLARQAGSLRNRASLGAWLHGVAYRISSKAQTAASRRRRHEQQAGLARLNHSAENCQPESFAVLDEELARLPDSFREPMVLCYFDGLTREEAARNLSLSPRTLKDRLERGRAMLRQALERRGVAGNTIAGLLPCADTVVPSVLASTTIRHATLFAVRSASRGAIPASVLALAEGVLSTTLVPHIHLVVLALLALGGLILGVGIASTPPRVEVRKAAPPVPPIEEAMPKVDRHGDALPEGALARLGTVRFRHGASIIHIALSRDGNVLATGGADGIVRLWDTRTGKLIREFNPGMHIYAVALSPDASRLACSTTQGDVRTFDVQTGKAQTRDPQSTRKQGERLVFTSLAISPNGKLLAGVAEGTTYVWRLADAERIHAFTSKASVGQMRVLSFSADGKLLGTGGDEPAVWDLTTGKRRVHFEDRKSHTRCTALSPDGKLMAVGYDDGNLTLWDTTTGKAKSVLSGKMRQTSVSGLAFTGDGKTLFSTGQHDESVHQWDVNSGKEVRTLPIDSEDGQNVAVSADGKTLAVAGGNHAARVWKAELGFALEELAFSEAHQSQVMHLAFSPDGKTLASTSWHGPARLWDVPSRRQIASQIGHAYGIYTLAFASDNKSLVFSCRDHKVRWCHPRTGALERTLPWGQESYPFAIGFLDGKTLVAGYSQKSVHLVGMGQKAELRPLKGDDHSVSQIRISPDGRTLVTSSHDDKTILVRDTATGQQTRKITGVIASWALALSADGKYLAAGESHLVRIWDLTTGKEHAPITSHPHRIVSLAFSRDGRWLASSCEDLTVRLWETESGLQAGLFRGHLSQAKGLAFSPDGHILASGSDDTSILLWDVSDRFMKDRPAKLTRQQLDSLWVDLAEDATKARHAIWTLARSPKESVPFLLGRLVVEPVDPKHVAKLITDLDDDTFDVRLRATKALQSLGEAAGPAMRKALATTPSAEVKLRLRHALGLLDKVKAEQKRLRILRAIAALEYAGTQEARRMLEAVQESKPE